MESHVEEKQDQRCKRDIPEHKKNEIREVFVLYDSDKDGYINGDELNVALHSLGLELKEVDEQKLIFNNDLKTPDHSGDYRVSFDQFFGVVSNLLSEQGLRQEIVGAFKLLDDDQTGKISLRNLRRAVRELGEQLSDDELRAMIEEFDKDGDGEINLDEFTAIMTGDSDDE